MLSLNMNVTIDTNVIYQALRNRNGASNFIIQLVRDSKVTLALSVPVFTEYQDVLLREKPKKDLKLNEKEIKSFLRLLAYLGKPFEVFFLMRPNLKDETDNMFVDLAFASNSKYLITNNITDFTRGNELKFDSFIVLTPSDFVKKWRQENE